jgi:ribosomal protein S18 acetylase RimI-like enzyme
MYYRESGAVRVPAGVRPSDFRKRQLMELAASGKPPGLIGYLGDVPAGWVSLGPRSAFIKLARSPVLKPVDDKPVWSLVRFVVAGSCRHRGVAEALLGGAVAYAAEQGADILEAYPVDKPEPGRDDSMWFGSKSMYDRAGFVEGARRRPERPIVRLHLTGVRHE